MKNAIMSLLLAVSTNVGFSDEAIDVLRELSEFKNSYNQTSYTLLQYDRINELLPQSETDSVELSKKAISLNENERNAFDALRANSGSNEVEIDDDINESHPDFQTYKNFYIDGQVHHNELSIIFSSDNFFAELKKEGEILYEIHETDNIQKERNHELLKAQGKASDAEAFTVRDLRESPSAKASLFLFYWDQFSIQKPDDAVITIINEGDGPKLQYDSEHISAELYFVEMNGKILPKKCRIVKDDHTSETTYGDYVVINELVVPGSVVYNRIPNYEVINKVNLMGHMRESYYLKQE